jgi:hypothetical protein
MLQRAASPNPQVALAPAPGPEPAKSLADAPLLEVSGDCLALFTTKVQPIMMNTCANCHSTGRGGNFVLARSTDAAGRRATQVNLSAALRQICFEQASSSPLLSKACSAHGGGPQAPLCANQAIPLETLKNWVELVVARNPQLRGQGVHMAADSATAPRPLEPTPPATRASVANADVLPSQQGAPFRAVPMTADPTTAADAKISPTMTNTAASATAPSPSPSPSTDPHDPMIFNQMFHPKQ